MKNKNIITAGALAAVLFLGQAFVGHAQEAVAPQEDNPVFEIPVGENLAEIEEVIEKVVELEEELPVYKAMSAKHVAKGLETIDAFAYSITRLQNLSGRISNKMNELEDEGVSIGTSRNKIKDSNNLIRSAFGEMKKIKEQTRKYIAQGRYQEGYIEETRAKLEAVKKNGEDAQRIMKEVVAILKDLAPEEETEESPETGILDSVNSLLETNQ